MNSRTGTIQAGMLLAAGMFFTLIAVKAMADPPPRPTHRANPAPPAYRISTYPSVYRAFDPATGVACYIYQSAKQMECIVVQQPAEVLGGERAPAGSPPDPRDPRESHA